MGEIGHLSKECPDEWPHCDTRYLDKGYPINQVTCFLCEGTTHTPVQCHLCPMVQKVNEQVREGMHKILERPVKVHEQEGKRKRDTSQVICFTCREMGHYSWDCPEKKVGESIKPNQFQEGHINPAKMEDEARLRTHSNSPKVKIGRAHV